MSCGSECSHTRGLVRKLAHTMIANGTLATRPSTSTRFSDMRPDATLERPNRRAASRHLPYSDAVARHPQGSRIRPVWRTNAGSKPPPAFVYVGAGVRRRAIRYFSVSVAVAVLATPLTVPVKVIV